MSEAQIHEMLQHCIAAYTDGLPPEECLALFPEHRAELEPLLRQALSLRIAFAAAPRPEFKAALQSKLMFAAGRETQAAFETRPDPRFIHKTRERLMFAAGREAMEAYGTEPDQAFKNRTRYRLLRAGGVHAQEALRDVPPPRLPFWINARRRLLDAASTHPQHGRQPAASLVLQRGLSLAIILISVTAMGVAYLTQNQPDSVSAEFAALEERLQQIEEQSAQGKIIPPGVLEDLTKRTTNLVDRLDDRPASAAPVTQKLPALIERQKDVVQAIASDSTSAPTELRQIQVDLQEAGEKVRILAARADQPTISAPQAQPTLEPTKPAPPTATAVPSATPAPTSTPVIPEGQVRISLVPNDTTYDLTWTEVRTSTIRFLAPSSWKLLGVTTSNGIASLDSKLIRIDGGQSAIVLIDTVTGEMQALLNGQAVLLRSEGPKGKTIDVGDLIARADSNAPALHHMVESIEVALEPTPSPTPTNTPAPTSTATPTASPTATSTATSTATPTATSVPPSAPSQTPTP